MKGEIKLMERFIDPCCDKCVNSKIKPCENFVECRLSGPICHENKECTGKRQAIIEKYNHSPGFFQH